MYEYFDLIKLISNIKYADHIPQEYLKGQVFPFGTITEYNLTSGETECPMPAVDRLQGLEENELEVLLFLLAQTNSTRVCVQVGDKLMGMLLGFDPLEVNRCIKRLSEKGFIYKSTKTIKTPKGYTNTRYIIPNYWKIYGKKKDSPPLEINNKVTLKPCS